MNNANKTLSLQERTAINQQISANETKQKMLQEKISALDEEIRSSEDDVQVCESNLDFVKKDDNRDLLTWAKGLVIDNDQVAAAKRELEESEEIHDNLSSTREKEIEELEELQDIQSGLQKKLHEEEGFISSMKKKVSYILSLFKTERIEQRLEGSITAMLHLIALFLLKTLLLPIAFLFLILRSFKLIWKIDLLALGIQPKNQ